jgi:uncharacterized membrane protein
MSPATLLERASRLAIATTALLIALLIGWQLPSATSPPRVLVAALLLLPAALVLFGLLRHRPRTRAWTILGAIPYLSLGVMELIANPGERAWAVGCTALAFAQFVMLAWLLRVQRAQH